MFLYRFENQNTLEGFRYPSKILKILTEFGSNRDRDVLTAVQILQRRRRLTQEASPPARR